MASRAGGRIGRSSGTGADRRDGQDRRAVAAVVLLAATCGRRSRPRSASRRSTLTEPSYTFDTAEQHGIKVTRAGQGPRRARSRSSSCPTATCWWPERGGGLRDPPRRHRRRRPRLDRHAVAGMPQAGRRRSSASACRTSRCIPTSPTNHLIYWTYNEPAPRPRRRRPAQPAAARSFKLMRGKLAERESVGVETLFAGRRVRMRSARGWRVRARRQALRHHRRRLSATSRRISPRSTARSCASTPTARSRGTIPSSASAGANPAIYTLRPPRPARADGRSRDRRVVLNAEHGPNGGDEVNLIKPGANYGWPTYTYGRHYDGTGLAEPPAAPGIEKPAAGVDPSIAPSGLMIYTGDKFPRVEGQPVRRQAPAGARSAGTGRLSAWCSARTTATQRRERCCSELHQRVARLRARDRTGRSMCSPTATRTRCCASSPRIP